MAARLLVLGVSPTMKGGIAAVMATLAAAGLERRVPVIHVQTFAEGGAAAKLRCFITAALRTAWLLARGQVGAVHAHVASNGSFWRKSLLLGLVRLWGIPTIFHLHGGGFAEFTEQQSGAGTQWWIRRSLTRSTQVVALSAQWAEWVQAFAPSARVMVISNPVVIPPAASEFDVAQGASSSGRVLYLGLVSRMKGTFDLVQAWAQAGPRLPGWRLQIGGNGEVSALQQHSQALGVSDSVDLLGWVAGSDKDALLARADLVVLPSYKEGIPMTVLEAMASAKAVLATPVGGVPDLIRHGEDGWLVAPGDVPALAKALDTLAGDAALRRRLGRAAREQVARTHAADRVLAQWLALYAALGVTVRPA